VAMDWKADEPGEKDLSSQTSSNPPETGQVSAITTSSDQEDVENGGMGASTGSGTGQEGIEDSNAPSGNENVVRQYWRSFVRALRGSSPESRQLISPVDFPQISDERSRYGSIETEGEEGYISRETFEALAQRVIALETAQNVRGNGIGNISCRLCLLVGFTLLVMYACIFVVSPIPGNPEHVKNVIAEMASGIPTLTFFLIAAFAALITKLLPVPHIGWLMVYTVVFGGVVGSLYGIGQGLEKIDSANEHDSFIDRAQSDFWFDNTYYVSMASVLVIIGLYGKYFWDVIQHSHQRR